MFESATKAGCNAVGVCNQEGLEGGPPSTDLTRQIPGARSAIVVADPVDEAQAYLEAMPMEKRALYEDIENAGTQD